MEDQIERGLKWFQDSRSSSKWSKSFPWKWSWLRRRSAFLSISGQFNFMEYHGIPSEYHLPCIQIFPCVRFNEFNDESSKAAWHRREAALGEWICPRVFVAEVLRSWMQMHICYGWMLNSQEKHTIYWLLCNIYIRICLNRTSFYRHVGVTFTIYHQSMPCRWVPSLAAEVVEPWHAQWCQKGVWGRGPLWSHVCEWMVLAGGWRYDKRTCNITPCSSNDKVLSSSLTCCECSFPMLLAKPCYWGAVY